MGKRFKLAQTLAFYWNNGQIVCEDYFKQTRIAVSPDVLYLLDRFSSPLDPASLKNGQKSAVKKLLKLGLLVQEGSGESEPLNGWHWGHAAKQFFFGTKDANVHLPKARRMAHAKRLLKESPQPDIYKSYSEASRVELHHPQKFVSSAGGTISKVRDIRDFVLKPIPKEWLSEILYLSCGEQGKVKAEPWGELLIKTYYSAGNRHPLEVYPVVVSVDGVEPGLYHYSIKDHALELLKKGDFSRTAKRIANSQTWVKNAAVYFLITAVFERTSYKYRHDYFLGSIYVDVGSLIQNIRIAAAGLGLDSCPTHSLSHGIANKFLGLDGIKESFLGLVPAGSGQRLNIPQIPAI